MDLNEAARNYKEKRRIRGVLYEVVKSDRRALGELEKNLIDAEKELIEAENVLHRAAIEAVNEWRDPSVA